MANVQANKPQDEIQEIAGGWITERKHTQVPGFLRFSYIIIGVSTVSYLVLQMYGDVGHPDRGSLVEQFNRISETSPGLMYGVAALAAVFFLAVIMFAFGEKEHD
ncbi:MAG: hypothetical protein HY820_08820 [Acidobacteria bacterium]|nr:hypothetical protein [Acidobacteriota bacterium]